MVLALAKKQPLVLVIHSRNIDFRVTLVIIAPVRANA